MKPDPWTPDRVGTLKVLWAQGLSCAAIAKKLGGGITRSAVIGKIHRLNLPMRAKSTAHRKGTKHAINAPAKKLAQLTPKLKAEPLLRPRAPMRGAYSVRHSERNWFQCPMFCAGEEGASGFICGAPIDFPAQKFCKTCSKFAYTPAPPVRVRRVA